MGSPGRCCRAAVPEAAIGGASAEGWPGRGEVDQPVTESIRCPACGKAIHPGDRFCAACGQQLGEPGFVPPAAPAAPPAAAGASGPGASGGWPGAAAATADAAWMPPARAATVAAVASAGPGRPEADAPDSWPTDPETPHGPGRDALVATEAAAGNGTVTGIGAEAGTTVGWGSATAGPSAVLPVSPPTPAVGIAAPAAPAGTGAAEDANWFVATRPSTLVAWGLILTVGGLLLGAIGQVDPTDTLVILAFLIVPLGLLLLPLALVCWVAQKVTGRR